jgi:hypothetical protein
MTARRYPKALLIVVAAVSAACGSTTTSPTSPARTSPVTELWAGLIGPGGTASRSFTTGLTGTVTVTLITADVPLGIGIGVPRTVNGGCRLSVSQEAAAAGVAVSAPAAVGEYCVQLFDEGNVVKQSAFTVQVVYP